MTPREKELLVLLILKDRIRRHYKHTWKKDELLKFIDKYEESFKGGTND